MDLESAVISSEATILSAIERKESIGAHQRNDSQENKFGEKFNVLVKLNKEKKSLFISKQPLKKLRKELFDLVSNKNRESSFKGKLLE